MLLLDKYLQRWKTAPFGQGAKDARSTSTDWADPKRLRAKWSKRARLAAQQIETPGRVLDLGCGEMLIERHLPKGCEYLPVDVATRDSRTIVCDFEQLQYPEVGQVNIVLLLGVLEWLSHPQDLIAHLPTYGASQWLISYQPADLGRKRRAAKNPLTEGQFITAINNAGFSVNERITRNIGAGALFDLRPSPYPADESVLNDVTG